MHGAWTIVICQKVIQTEGSFECYGHEQTTNPPDPHEYRCSTGKILHGNKQSQDSLKLRSDQSDCCFQAPITDEPITPLILYPPNSILGKHCISELCQCCPLSSMVPVDGSRASSCMMVSEVEGRKACHSLSSEAPSLPIQTLH